MIEVKMIQIPGLPTKNPRRLYVSLPRDYDKTDERYPVVYMFDGHNVFYDRHATYGRSWGMRAYLNRAKRRFIVVGVECNPEGNERLSEYSPWDFDAWDLGLIEGRGRQTMDWFAHVLKPEIDAGYRTLPDREHTMIAGSSMGGLMAVWAAVAYNGVYGKAASLSPCLFLHEDRIADLIKSSSLQKPTRIYMDYGSAETEEQPGDWALMFRTAALLSEAGAYTAARVIQGAQHNEAAWEKRIPVFMDFLWDEG
ncbi:MAG: alpha/beta hydrolase [Lachnospiraceae bacterium]|nr:alpha/beta hydrolase [Lachnospiraceae bacterium]